MSKPKLVKPQDLKDAIDEVLRLEDAAFVAKKAHEDAVRAYNEKLNEHFGYRDGQQLSLARWLSLMYTVAKGTA